MQCFRNFPVAKKFMDKGGGRRRRRYQNFASKFFCLNSAENFLKEPSELLNLSFLLELYIFFVAAPSFPLSWIWYTRLME